MEIFIGDLGFIKVPQSVNQLGFQKAKGAGGIYRKLFAVAGICFVCGLVISFLLAVVWPKG